MTTTPRYLAIADVQTGAIVWQTGSYGTACEAWLPGTIWGGGDTPEEAQRQAQERAAKSREAGK